MALFSSFQRSAITTVIRLLPEKGVMEICDGDEVKTFPIDTAMLNRGEIASALQSSLAALPQYSVPRSAAFILPHTLYGVDFVSLPNMKKAQLGESFKTELRSMHKNYDALSFQSAEIYAGKTSVTFRVAFARSELLNELRACFLKVNIKIEKFLPYGSALLEGAMQLGALRKNPCLVLDIGERYAYIAAYGKDTLLGGAEIPFGVEALSSTRVIPERLLSHQDSAELLVINAKERAKSMKLTMAINLEEEGYMDGAPPEEAQPAPEQATQPLAEEVAETVVAETAVAATDEDKEEFDDEEAEIPEKDLPLAVKTLKKTIRQLPKFMRREEPTTAEGYIAENFRLFEKRVLLIAREMSLNEYFPKIETIYVSMPEEFSFLIDKMNESNPSFKWAYLDRKDAKAGDTAIFGAFTPSGKMPAF